MKPMQLIKMLLVFYLLPFAARAEDPVMPIEFTGHYDMAFATIPFGELDITLSQSPHNYYITNDIRLTGLAKIFVQHESHTTSNGSGANFMYPDSTYESRYSTKNKPKYVRMVTEKGIIVSEKVEPLDSPSTRPPVKAEDKKGAVDPVFLALAIRADLINCLKEHCQAFSQNYYDGRRLIKLDFTYAGEKNIRIKGEKYPSYRLTVKRTPLAGHTEKELRNIGPNDPTLTIYFSHDERVIPMQLEVPLSFGVASATLRM